MFEYTIIAIPLLSLPFSTTTTTKLSVSACHPQQMEESLSALVVKKTVYAKIDRPAGIITFKENLGAAHVLQEWSTANSSLMRQVDHAAHVIEKEMMTLRAGGK